MRRSTELFSLLASATVLLASLSPALANSTSDPMAALTKKCVKCHGSDGAGNEKNPPIAGMPEQEFIDDLKAYRDGSREHKMMNLLSKKLSDAEIADLAAHYGAMPKQ